VGCTHIISDDREALLLRHGFTEEDAVKPKVSSHTKKINNKIGHQRELRENTENRIN